MFIGVSPKLIQLDLLLMVATIQETLELGATIYEFPHALFTAAPLQFTSGFPAFAA